MDAAFQPSQDLIAAARMDLERLRELAVSLRGRRAQLAREMEDLNRQLRDVGQQMRRLGDVIGLDPKTVAHSERGEDEEPEIVDGRQVLRGAHIREIAIRVLLDRSNPSADIHYRQWVQLIEQAGFQIAGRDPGAVLLTQISRSPLVVRAPDSGQYRLDRDAMVRLRDQHLHIEEAMRTAVERNDGLLTPAQLSGELNRLSSEERRVRRQLEELVRTVSKVGAQEFFGLQQPDRALAELRVA
jgi:hypothetical protein